MLLTRVRLLILVLLVASLPFLASTLTAQLYRLLRLPFIWDISAADSMISQERDQFDITFRSYPVNGSTTDSDQIPARLHHIHLGDSPLRPEWLVARSECLAHHPDWEAYLWDDAAATRLVHEDFPDLVDLWKNYPYLVQRVDALRYMVLYKYGGAILDFDLVCRRSLDPLRRFEFVAPAAYPSGFSVGMLLSTPNSSFVHELVDNLPAFNRRWFYLPYATVMFSAGCHYASTIFTSQRNRTALRILSGPPEHRTMHMLNGFVETPLFRHLGTSSWHGSDIAMLNVFNTLGKNWMYMTFLGMSIGVIGLIILAMLGFARRTPPERNATVLKSA
ncbi:hypothetical protein EYZ11_009667 [Aspergillus tanneri]|uniref:Membrane-bound alpha-1,6-mannosyltransferase Initiation-specific n=1 Tax=Aspergillus tanneri TaxID=1220188 RepID=A0A4S3J7B9_9EURO|nr:uncharacterized protein ATNIH1004_007435 [Aspergillus tanneri]KAA8646013.1 hypothetical protein ATNIH1004_007435 [Aspergillus tanneri]THC90869.1 hypothetical protein EYZ11_009667 [Aspergillus tanneri]